MLQKAFFRFVILGLIAAPLEQARSEEVAPITIPRPEASEPAFDGWGTSLCWFANAVGRWPDETRGAIADLLFSPQGLGLTAVRYNIGGGEQPGHTHMPAFRQMEGFQPESGKWTWEADAGQRWMLQAAIARGANRLEAFSNAPPYWMTVSGCASGGEDPKRDNLRADAIDAFVDYLVDVVRHFRDVEKIEFQTLDPFNESTSDYWKAQGKQEGCHFDAATQAVVLKRLRARLAQKNLGTLRIAASDETNFDAAIRAFTAYDPEAKALVDVLNAHAYATERRTELAQLAHDSGKILVMSEVDGGGGKGHDHEAMPPAFELAERIFGDLKHLHPLRWVFWQVVEDEKGQATADKNWGLIHADLGSDSHTYALTKKYYAFAQFSRFIRPGAHFIAVGDERALAAWDPVSARLVLVFRNESMADESISFDLSAYASVGQSREVAAWRTSKTENLASLSAGTVSARRLTITSKAQSITTVTMRIQK